MVIYSLIIILVAIVNILGWVGKENLHFDNEEDIHMSSKSYGKNCFVIANQLILIICSVS
jgi:hypothetical protein